MKKLLLIGTVVLLMATSAHAQFFGPPMGQSANSRYIAPSGGGEGAVSAVANRCWQQFPSSQSARVRCIQNGLARLGQRAR